MINKKRAAQLTICIIVISTACEPSLGEKVYSEEPLIIGDDPVDEVFVIGSETEFYHTGGIMVTGKGTLIVNGIVHQRGHVYITENGTLRVEGGEFHIEGYDTNVYLDKGGSCIFTNALLHYVQEYVAQHNLVAGGNGHFEFTDSSVDCDGSIEFVHLVDTASYKAVNTHFTDWTTWYLYDQTVLSLEDVNYAGDVVFYDSPTLTFVNTQVIMPWLYFGKGAVVEYQFPSESASITIDSSLEGVSGIPWTLTMENCSQVAWGINPYPGSDVTIRDSHLTMVMFRFAGEGEFDLQGIMRNESYYKDETIPVTDRNFRLVNTFVKWWKVDVIDRFQLHADSIVFSEMVLKGNSKAYLKNSICEGQTIHLGATEDTFLYFEKGEVWSFVSVWDNAVMVLQDSLVDWEKGKFIYQTSNIAHGHSRLYCLNSILKSKPEAVDSALVIVAAITGPDRGRTGEKLSISGAAWIDTGPDCDSTFARYELCWGKNGDWTLITKSVNPADGILGVWDTSGLPEGEYELRLQIWVDNDENDHPPDAYPVYKVVTLFSDTSEIGESPPEESERSAFLGALAILIVVVAFFILRKRKG